MTIAQWWEEASFLVHPKVQNPVVSLNKEVQIQSVVCLNRDIPTLPRFPISWLINLSLNFK